MGMDPLLLMDRLELVGMQAIGAILEDEKTKKSIPVGLLVYTESAQGYRIYWMCVSPEYHMEGIGAGLLIELFDSSIEKGYASIEAYFNQIPERSQYCPAELTYFTAHLFQRKRRLPGEWIGSIGELAKTFSKRNPAMDGHILPFSRLSAHERKEVLTKLDTFKKAIAFHTLKQQELQLDLEVSMFSYENGNINGALLVQSVEVTDPIFEGGRLYSSDRYVLYPVFLLSGSKQGAFYLMEKAVQAAADKYQLETQVCIISSLDNMKSLYDRLLPGCHIDSYSLLAEVKDYVSMRENSSEDYIL